MVATVNIEAADEQAQILGKQSYAAYLQAVETHDQLRIEYIHGDIVMTPSAVPKHQIISANLMDWLRSHAKKQGLGLVLAAPLDVQLEEARTIVQPDIIFIQQARIETLVGEQRIHGAPDLVAEILSPSTARIDRAIKLQTYARYGVAEYWIVNLVDTTVEVYTLHEQNYLVAGVYESGEVISAGQFAKAKIAVDAIFAHA
jgi:Uma2 family endonuclease